MSFKKALAVAALALAACIAGCKATGRGGSTVYVIDGSSATTNIAPAGAFNDERYVWESFYFSTNQVKDAKK